MRQEQLFTLNVECHAQVGKLLSLNASEDMFFFPKAFRQPDKGD